LTFFGNTKEWHNISFKSLSTEGAFLILAKKENEVVTEMTIKCEAGGSLFVKLPFPTWLVTGVEQSKIIVEKEQQRLKQ
jgi:hypothetical protein